MDQQQVSPQQTLQQSTNDYTVPTLIEEANSTQPPSAAIGNLNLQSATQIAQQMLTENKERIGINIDEHNSVSVID